MASIFEPALFSPPPPPHLTSARTRQTYQPLNQAAQQIRLVHLFPASYRLQKDRDIVSCFTQVVSLEDYPSSEEQYLALSYTWGNVSQTTPIFLDNQRIHVTEHLANALQRFEHEDQVLRLWVDAICINQADDDEKTAQVGLMAEIFRRATGVLVWLGPKQDDSDEGLEALKQLGLIALQTLISLQRQPRNSSQSPVNRKNIWDHVLTAMRPTWFPSDVPAFNLEAVLRILERPWFRRVWVLQEAALNNNVAVFCGQQTIKRTVLWAGARTAVSLSNEILMDSEYTHGNATMWRALAGSNFLARRTLYLITSRTKKSPLEAILSDITMNLGEWSYEATDPRDRVFAVVGFTSDSNALGIVPDYTTSCAHVYSQATEAILTSSRTLDILYAVSGQKSVQGLPSWVPDWSTPNASTFGPRRIGRFCAAGVSSVSTVSFRSDTNGNRLLSLSGHTVDTVHLVLQEQWHPQWDLSALKVDSRMVRFIRHLQNFGTGHAEQVYSSEEARLQALWKTPIADCDAFLKTGLTVRPAASEKMERSFEAFIKLAEPGATNEHISASRPYVHTMNLESARRRVFMTSKGYYGIADENLLVGDTVCVIFGGDSPFIARETDLGNYKLIGEAYLHGIMSGEYLRDSLSVEHFTFC